MTRAVPNGGVSFWYAQLGKPDYRPGLPGDTAVDVAIVGAGYTGLWTAYYLKKAQPDLRIVVLEKEFAGFGASGRNGGWLTANLAGSASRYAASHGRAATLALQRAMMATVDEVIEVAAAEGIDADIHKGGNLEIARSPAQLGRLRDEYEQLRHWGYQDTDVSILDGAELAGRIRVQGAVGGIYSQHCARLQPAKLVRGLARVVEGLGVRLYERTEVLDIESRRVRTNRGTVTADVVLRCLEGFTAGLAGERRSWLPMNSSMIVTEQLPDYFWAEVGWREAETLGDMAHAYMYAQRTADGRIALGGRGVPYRFASRTDHSGATQIRTVAALSELLRQLFPAAVGASVAHAWCGVLGVPRDWCSTVRFDRPSGLGTAGGYVGHGVATTNLAGRTLRDLVLRRDSELTRLPWVGRRVRRWEPEPLRFLGVRSLYALYRFADRQEYRGRPTTSPIARIADRVAGRY
ncbi:NAD(P)/FAD-dependent oxidoreductase [Fodinicola feengrottensis]|uniref:FAD-binding oxidoreductase n=1 Tax=Fodinicola feengrottensis TaxID=435914 RepID=A0ABN2HQJ6_9ACTN|nr:FAD-binding oxidoreductase [Fodinicola feengrottensis]